MAGNESPGVVWIYCPYPVVAAGLRDALEDQKMKEGAREARR